MLSFVIFLVAKIYYKFPGGTSAKELPANAGGVRDARFSPWVGKIPWSRKWQPIPAFPPGESRGQRSLVDYSTKDHRVGQD